MVTVTKELGGNISARIGSFDAKKLRHPQPTCNSLFSETSCAISRSLTFCPRRFGSRLK
jgi:hypothetical protein